MKTKKPTSPAEAMTQTLRFGLSDSLLVWAIYLMFVIQLGFGIYTQSQFQGVFSMAMIIGIFAGRVSAIPDAQTEDNQQTAEHT